MRKIAALLAGATIALGLSLSIQPPANASQLTSKCSSSWYEEGAVCMVVSYYSISGDFGWHINSITLMCDKGHWAFGWDHPAVDGHGLGIYKNPYAGYILKRYWDDAHSNVDTDDGGGTCERTIQVDTTYENADVMAIDWAFTEQRNLRNDLAGDIHILLKDAQD